MMQQRPSVLASTRLGCSLDLAPSEVEAATAAAAAACNVPPIGANAGLSNHFNTNLIDGVNNGEGSGSNPCLTCSRGSSSGASSPETLAGYGAGGRRRSWLKRSGLFKELDSGIRRAGVSLRGSLECLLSNCSSAPPGRSVHFNVAGANPSSACFHVGEQNDKRKITVEIPDKAPHSRHHNKKDSASNIFDTDDEDMNFDQSEHNFSSSLTLNTLMDGVFSAQMTTESIPAGDILIRVHNYRLELIVHQQKQQHQLRRTFPPHDHQTPDDLTHRTARPYYCGSVDVPIYVDTSTLHFRIDAERDVICIEGCLKGYLNRQACLSTSDVEISSAPPSSMSLADVGKKAMRAKGLPTPGHVLALNAGKGGHSNSSWMSRFRNRANTH